MNIFQALKHSSTQALKHSSTQALKHSSTQALKHSSTQALKHSSTQALKLALLLLFCLTACVGEGNLLITKFGRQGNGIKETTTTKPIAPALSARGNHNLVINSDGELYAWGRDYYGQLGDGTSGSNTNKNTPVRIGTASNWVSAAAGVYHSLAINTDGELYAWGNNSNGQLGDGTNDLNAHKNTPTRIGASTNNINWVSVVAGDNHSLVINEDGELYAWGSNNYGQLGDGTRINKNTPTRIGTSTNNTNWVKVFAGSYHSLAINENGELYAWGNNSGGQLGDGTSGSNTHKNTPTRIGTSTNNTNWVSAAAGVYHSLAINTDGELYAWGSNSNEQLGHGTSGSNTHKNTPTRIGTASNWVKVSAGSYHSLAINTDGWLYAWGYNYYGQLGDGTRTSKNTPTRIGAASNWVKVSAGLWHSLAINTDGELYAWGNNRYGQLGDGTNAYEVNPVAVKTQAIEKDED